MSGFGSFGRVRLKTRADHLHVRMQLTLDPRHEEVDYARLAFGRDVRSLRDLPPFLEAAAAAACAGVLRLEDGMSAHRGLPAVVGRAGRREPRAGLQPNGRRFSTTVMNFYTFDDDGKIFKDVAATGIAGILRGIGAIK